GSTNNSSSNDLNKSNISSYDQRTKQAYDKLVSNLIPTPSTSTTVRPTFLSTNIY
ncbi:unnamed protein product, partial [Rotaria sp. Silwood1]